MAHYRVQQKQTADETATDESTAPAQSANKAEWVDYAVSNGADRTEAESMTKAELQQQYG